MFQGTADSVATTLANRELSSLEELNASTLNAERAASTIDVGHFLFHVKSPEFLLTQCLGEPRTIAW